MGLPVAGWFGSEGSFACETLTSEAALSLCQGPWVLGGEARCCVLPGLGGYLPGEATALLLSDPDFQPHTHSMVFFLFFLLAFWVFCFRGFLFGVVNYSPHPTLVLHLFLLVLFWTSVPFSVLD